MTYSLSPTKTNLLRQPVIPKLMYQRYPLLLPQISPKSQHHLPPPFRLLTLLRNMSKQDVHHLFHLNYPLTSFNAKTLLNHWTFLKSFMLQKQLNLQRTMHSLGDHRGTNLALAIMRFMTNLGPRDEDNWGEKEKWTTPPCQT